METTIAPPAAAEPELEAAADPADAERQQELAAELREAILRKVGAAVSGRSAAGSR